MHNYWLIFFTFGDRKGCKIILARLLRKERPSWSLFFIMPFSLRIRSSNTNRQNRTNKKRAAGVITTRATRTK